MSLTIEVHHEEMFHRCSQSKWIMVFRVLFSVPLREWHMGEELNRRHFLILLFNAGSPLLEYISQQAQCLKNTEKVSFTIASEASYVHILSGQKLIKNAKKWFILASFWKTWSLRSNSVTRQVTFNRTKIGGKCQNVKNSNKTFWIIFKHCKCSKKVCCQK